MLRSLIIVAAVVLLLSVIGVVLSRRWSTTAWSSRVLLLVCGPIDGVLSMLMLNWLGASALTAAVGGLLLGIMSMLFVQPMLLPQRLLVWRLARENMLRRKRQSVLMISGLIIASAIITSSMVVGDSLDKTVGLEVQAAWGETDLLISGRNPTTGVSVAFDEDLGERFWDALTGDAVLSSGLDGRQFGVASSVSLSAENGLAEPSISMFARNASVDDAAVWAAISPSSNLRYSDLVAVNRGAETPSVVLNSVAAETLEVGQGDVLEVGAFVTRDGERVRTTTDVAVFAVVANEGQGAMAGTRSPAVFTDLLTAQSILGMDGELNQVSLAFDDALDESELRRLAQRVEEVMNDVMTAEDAGTVWTVDEGTSSLTISSTLDLQRVSGEDVAALRENRSTLYPSASLLEVLQVPLIDVVHNGSSLLTLADGTVSELRAAPEAVWHVSPSGLGFERLDTGDAWIWQVSDGERLVDAAWGDRNESVAFVSGRSVVVADIDLVDEDERYTADLSADAVAVTKSASGWRVLLVDSEGLSLASLDEELEVDSIVAIDVPLPGTVLNYGLVEQGQTLHVSVEGLLTTTHHRSSVATLAFEQVEAGPEAEPQQPFPEAADERCDGRSALAVGEGTLWCTFEHGLLIVDGQTNNSTSLRLPVLSDALGFGQLPQMVLAFGGEGAALSVDDGFVLTSARLSSLGLTSESSLAMTGILPYAYGNDSATSLTHGGDYTSVEGFDQLSDLDPVVLGLVSLSDAEELALAGEDDRSLLMFSGEGFGGENTSAFDALQAWFDERSGLDDVHLAVRAVQLDAAEQAEASSGALSAMFLVFGTFTIAAGSLLSLTIIMLLADVRRKELATVRALGLRRSDARALFVYEGAVLAFVSSGVGSLVGLVLAWVISVGFSSIFSSVGAQAFTFAWTIDSLLAGWFWGALLALLILWCSALYNAQLTIVRALRGARASVNQGVPWGVVLLQVLALGLVGLCTLSLLVSGLSGGVAYAAYVLLGIGLIVLLTPLATWQIPVLLNRKGPANRWTRFAARNTLGAVGGLFLVWTLLLAPVDPVRQQMEPNELAFIVLGLLQVLAGVLVLTSFAPLIVGWLAKQRWVVRRTGPVGSVALAHPLAHPVRTAVVMGMFSITMFSVVVLAGYTEQFDTYSSDFVEEAEGEFELLLTSTRSRPIELGEDPDAWGIDHESLDGIDAVGGVYRAPIHLLDAEGERMPYLLRGVDAGFRAHGGLPLHVWDSSLGNTSEEAWSSLGLFEHIVFLDASFGLESTADGTSLVPLQFSIGDSISLIDFTNPKNTRNVTVGGFLKQSSYIFSPGVWMNGHVVETQFSGKMTRLYVSVAPDAVPTDDYDGGSKAPQGKSVVERQAASELEGVLDVELASRNINVQTVADEIMVIQSLVLAILALFEGYLALGLLVGVAGIGVVTVRNVSERRRTVGMLRAIGFRQRHVLRLFSVEVSWVAVLGMLNGLIIGYGFHVVLYKAVWEAEGAAFSFPWASTLMLFFGGWLVVLLTTFVPVRSASKIPPSAALRNL